MFLTINSRGGPADIRENQFLDDKIKHGRLGFFSRFMEGQAGKTMAEIDDKNQPAMFDGTRGQGR